MVHARIFASFLLFTGFLSAQKLPTDELNKELPKWVKFSGEERLRSEAYSGLSYQDNSDTYLVHRFRINLTLTPTSWLTIFAQGQDARAFFKTTKPYAPPFQNTWDLRQTYATIGNLEKSRAAVRVGRQELAFGEERLIGVSNWTNTSRSFDAARAMFRYHRFRVDAFASSVVVLTDGQVGSVTPGSNLHGLYGNIKDALPGLTIEPYVFWRLQPRVKSELGAVGNSDMKIPGFRAAGKYRALDYSTEMVLERGSLAADDISAWAGHWLVGYSLKAVNGLRVYQEYNYASGDGNAHDGTRRTFDQLYPSGHDKLGLNDQVGWRNIEHLRTGAEWKRKKLTVAARYNEYWLADAHDSLYNSSGTAYVTKATGTAGRWVGHGPDLLGVYQFTKFAQAGAGFSHIFPGTFLQLATPGHSYSQPYVFVTTQF